MHRVMPRAKLAIVKNVGHCPHLSAPSECSSVMDDFLASVPHLTRLPHPN
jgi:sigma-B regulation protein RsbQ